MDKKIEKFFMEMTEEEQELAIALLKMKVKHDKDKLSGGICVGKGKEERKQILGFPSNPKGEPCPLLQKRLCEWRMPEVKVNFYGDDIY